MRKIIMIALALLVIAGTGLYFYMYKGHRDISSESADYSRTVKDLQKQFTANTTEASKKYADKTIEVYGKITAVDLATHTIIMDEKLSAVFNDSVIKIVASEKQVKIKGRFLGYDDLLEEFKMDQVSLEE